MTIKVNGQDRPIEPGTTIRALAAMFNIVPEKIAIELNRRLVRRDGYDRVLAEGDQVELVTFVGGG
jgi:thiamine biosynthesis protein ThiS